MPEPKPPAPTNLAFKVVTVIAAGLLLSIGVCGLRLSLGQHGNQDFYVPNSLIFLVTGISMLIVVAVWLVFRAILRKDKQ
jgi:hypothetical protein